MNFHFLESIPTVGIFFCIVLLILVSCEIGFGVGRHHRRNQQATDAHASIGPMVGGLLGMLAFVLAITFSMAAAQQERRKQDVLAEANIIGTAYLRADLLSKQRAAAIKQLLREYVDVRLQAARPDRNLAADLKRSLEIHDLLWKQVSAAAIENPTDITALEVSAVNDLIDMHSRRYNDAVRVRIPGSVWFGLVIITVLTMVTLGVHVGSTGKRWLVAVVPLSIAFAVLVTLVVDLNRPQGGFITVSQQPMIDLQNAMDRSAR